jgi:hypothetical protein
VLMAGMILNMTVMNTGDSYIFTGETGLHC